MKHTHKQTPLHAKQLKRVRSLISRAEKRGYRFSDTLKQNLYSFSTQKLKSLTPQKLYEQATAYNPETGEIITGTEARKIERSLAAKRRTQPKEEYYPSGGEIIFGNVVEEFIERLQEPTPQYATSRAGREYRRNSGQMAEADRQKNYLLNLTMQVARDIGIDELGWRLEKRADRVSELTQLVMYGSSATAIRSAATELASIINNGSLSMEQMRDISEQEEFNENWSEPD